jgi:hypothetical protein
MEDEEIVQTSARARSFEWDGTVWHRLKLDHVYFDAVLDGDKNFEVRRDDRDPQFAVGHFLVLEEWYPSSKEYSGRSVTRRVTFVLESEDHEGVNGGHVVMGMVPA